VTRTGRILRTALFFLAAGAVAGVSLGVYLTRDIPQVDSLQFTVPLLTTKVYARDGSLMQEYGAEKRILAPYAQISPHFFDALVAVEDATFYQHHGVSPRGVLRAVLKDVFGRRLGQGGSTITQQLARKYFLTDERTFTRKFREMILAVNIENRYSKQQILELYANKMCFGHGYYGVESASRFFFGKSARDLSVPEAATLAGIVQRPSAYSPLTRPEATRDRRNHVLERMWRTGKLTEAQYKEFSSQPLRVARAPEERGAGAYVSERVRLYLLEKYGEEAVYETGLQVYTTVDPALQSLALKAVREGLHEYSRRRTYKGPLRGADAPPEEESAAALTAGARVWGTVTAVAAKGLQVRAGGREFALGPKEWAWVNGLTPTVVFKEGDRVLLKLLEEGGAELEQTPQAQAALIALDPHSGEVLALVGGYDFSSSMFNRAIQARRQTGSAVKPLIYSQAFADGVTLADTVVDEPYCFLTGREQADQLCDQAYLPHDFDPDYFGYITYRTALEHSVNTCAVHLLNRTGMLRVIDLMKRLHITTDLKPYPSMGLGAFEITLWDLTGAYAAMDNQGSYVEPHFVRRVTDREGRTLEESRPVPEPALDPTAAFLITQAMTGVIQRGTAGSAADMKGHFAGKTGTMDDYVDSWFVGYNPNLVCGVWAGRDDRKPLGRLETGARVALPIWRRFMEPATRGQEAADWAVPDTVTQVLIDPRTGLLAGPECAGAREEYFLKGTEPRQACGARDHQRLRLPYFLQRYAVDDQGRITAPEADLDLRAAQYPGTVKREGRDRLMVSWGGTTFSLPVEIAAPREGPVPQAVMPGLPHEGSVSCGGVVEYLDEKKR